MDSRWAIAEDLDALERRRLRSADPASTRATAEPGLRPLELHVLGLQREAGNRAVVQLLAAPGFNPRAENGDTSEDDQGSPDWSAPIEPEADTRSEPRWVQRHDDEQDLPSDRSEGGAVVTQRQAGAGAAGAAAAAPAAGFPTFPQVRWNATVSNAMWRAWAATVRAATTTTRREQGFWVQWDRTTTRNANGDMRIVGEVTAPTVGNAAGATVNLGARPADAGDWATVASFHTHTPTRHRTVGRVVGPSTADNNADTNDKVTGLVYDYTAVFGGAIPAGHPLWSAAQVYHSGPNSRV